MTAIEELRKFVHEKATDRLNDLDALLKQIDAPDHLRGFHWLTRRLHSVLTKINPFLVGQDDKSWVRGALDFLDWYATQAEPDLVRDITQPDFFMPPRHAQDNPMKTHGMKHHGVYSALFHAHEDPGFCKAWDLLAGHILIAFASHVRIHGTGTQIPDPRRVAYPATLALRQLSRLESVGYISRLLKMDPAGFAKALWDKNIPTTEPQLREISLYLSFVYGIRERGEGHSHDGVVDGTRAESFNGHVDIDSGRIWSIDQTDADDPASPAADTDIVTDREDPEIARELEEIDLNPRELETGESLLLNGVDCKKARRGGATAYALAAKGRQKYIERQAQHLPWQYGMLTEAEVFGLWNFLEAQAETASKSEKPKDRLRLEACLLVQIMLVSGSALERALTLDYHEEEKSIGGGDLVLYRHQSPKTGYEWRIKAIFPSYRTTILVDPDLERKRNRHFYIPDVTGLGPIIIEKLGIPKGRDHRFFSKKIETYRKNIRQLLREFAPSGRPTFQQIGQHLNRLITAKTNDEVAGAMICGLEPKESDTRIFYTTHLIDYLREIYLEVMQPLISRLANKGRVFQRVASAQSAHVGARVCLKTETYQNAIGQLKSSLLQAGQLRSWSDFVEYHNRFTFYVVLYWNLATAARAITNPLPYVEEIDCPLAHTTVSDKDTQPIYHARFVWVPPAMQTQLQHYWAHLQHTKAYLRIRFGASPIPNESGFLLTPEGKAQAIRPRTLRPYFSEFLPAPENAHRRYLRTELLQRGLDVESVDALQGHWSRGEEPWGKYSSFDIGRHVDQLRRYLQPLLDELGLTPIASPFLIGG